MQNDVQLSNDDRKRLATSLDYLIFEAKRVPRKFISVLRENIRWTNDTSLFATTDAVEKYDVYRRVMSIIDIIEETEMISRDLPASERDFFTMQLMLTAHQITSAKSLVFTKEQLEIKSLDILPANWTALAAKYSETFFDRLVNENVIERVYRHPEEEGFFRLTGTTREAITNVGSDAGNKAISKEMTEFRNIVRAVVNASFGDLGDQPSLSRMLLKLDQVGAFNFSWRDNNDLVKAFDNMDHHLNDPLSMQHIEDLLKAEKINLDLLIHRILDYLGNKKSVDFFAAKGFLKYEGDKNPDMSFDLVLQNVPRNTRLIFDFKFREINPVPDANYISDLITKLLSETNEKQSLHLVVVVFTNANAGTFENAKLRFKSNVKKAEGVEAAKQRIHFIPVSTTNLPLLENELTNFSTDVLEENIKVRFIQQEPPPGYPERNDCLLEKFFNFKKSDIEVNVQPFNTQYWRVGFSFSINGQLPVINQHRHLNPRMPDLLIKVGNVKEHNIKEWEKPNELDMDNYHVDVASDNFKPIANYSGESVTIRLLTKNNHATFLEVEVGGKLLGNKMFDLSAYSHCVLSGWADGQPFQLECAAKVIYHQRALLQTGSQT